MVIFLTRGVGLVVLTQSTDTTITRDSVSANVAAITAALIML